MCLGAKKPKHKTSSTVTNPIKTFKMVHTKKKKKSTENLKWARDTKHLSCTIYVRGDRMETGFKW